MEREYNYQSFTPEEVEQGLFLDLVNYLIDYNRKCESGYYDIHITSDGYCTIVEWVDISYNFKGEEGEFKYVPSNGYVMLEYQFPDNHYENFYSKEEYEEALKQWLEDNPGWVKGHFGWTNEIKNKKLKEELEKENNEEE